jgi:hypothetical protein
MEHVLVPAFELIAHLGHGSDRLPLMRALRPRDEDYALVFHDEVLHWVRAAAAEVWRAPRPPAVLPEQQTLCVWSARAADLASGNEIAAPFPGGYAEIARHLRPDPIWLCWEFKVDAADDGVCGDGLVWIDDHFAWFPKPWRMIPGGPRMAPAIHWVE